jgi:hypothetical protein
MFWHSGFYAQVIPYVFRHYKKMLIKIKLLEKGPRKTLLLVDIHQPVRSFNSFTQEWMILENIQTGIVINNIKQLLQNGWILCGEICTRIYDRDNHARTLEEFFEGRMKTLPHPIDRFVAGIGKDPTNLSRLSPISFTNIESNLEMWSLLTPDR